MGVKGVAMKKQVVKPLIDEMDARCTKPLPKPQPQTAELDQDPGGGYNTIHDDPQT